MELAVRVLLIVTALGLLLFRVFSKSGIARIFGPLSALFLVSSMAHYAVANSLPAQIWGPIILVMFGPCIAWAIYEGVHFRAHTNTNTK